jgi:hypothetical protein
MFDNTMLDIAQKHCYDLFELISESEYYCIHVAYRMYTIECNR